MTDLTILFVQCAVHNEVTNTARHTLSGFTRRQHESPPSKLEIEFNTYGFKSGDPFDFYHLFLLL